MIDTAYLPAPLAPMEAGKHAISGIIDRSPGSLKPWPRNPRQHSEQQLIQLMASIREFGFTSPVLTDENGTILCGHGRVEAALRLGLATVTTQIISGLSHAKKRALVIADNKLALNSTWDLVILQEELELLIEDQIVIEPTGFTTAEVDLMFETPAEIKASANAAAQAAQVDEDGLRPADVHPFVVTKPGDLFLLGKHRLLCGNALDPASYQTLLQGEVAQMLITDPPYNVRIDGHASGNGQTKHAEFAMASGEMSREEFTSFLRQALGQMHPHCGDGAIAYVFMDWRHLLELIMAAEPLFGEAKQMVVWHKPNAGMGSFYRSAHELVYLYKKGTAPHINNFELGQHGRYRTNVWTYPGATAFKDKSLVRLHPTVKPTPMISDAIRDCSHLDGLVLDPFAGSGTILMAAERTKRQARAMELEPRYIDLAIHRWQRLTGQHAVLASTGQTFEALRQERMAQAISPFAG